MENMASYPFMADVIRSGQTHLHALWFEISTGDIHYFSRRAKVTNPFHKYVLNLKEWLCM